MATAFFDTTIVVDLVLKKGQVECTRAAAAIARYQAKQVPWYAIKEFDAGEQWAGWRDLPQADVEARIRASWGRPDLTDVQVTTLARYIRQSSASTVSVAPVVLTCEEQLAAALAEVARLKGPA